LSGPARPSPNQPRSTQWTILRPSVLATIDGMTMSEQSDLRVARLKKLLPSLVLNGAVPFVAYVSLRQVVGSDLVALLIGVAIPVVVTLVGFAVRRRVDRIGIASIVAFGLLIGVWALTGGDPLILKLREAVFTGPLGLVALVSVAIGRPVAALVSPLRRTLTRRQLGLLTLLVGATLVVHCAVVLGLALALPTATYLAIGRPAAQGEAHRARVG
jgi:hypothetical protein